MPEVFDCPACGRHYEEEDVIELRAKQERTGYCCEYCKEDNGTLNHKELRIKQLTAQIRTSAAELWLLTNPTKDEISNIREDYRGWDNDELVDQLVTDEFKPENVIGWFQALSTALDVLDYRVAIAEEKESDNANPE